MITSCIAATRENVYLQWRSWTVFYELIWWKTRIKIKQTLHKDKTRVSENERSQIYVIIAIFHKCFFLHQYIKTHISIVKKIKLHITQCTMKWSHFSFSLVHYKWLWTRIMSAFYISSSDRCMLCEFKNRCKQ